jgi:hypothetical protein
VHNISQPVLCLRGREHEGEVATMTSMNIGTAVSGYGRAAASARLLAAAARPWMTGAGVCPAAVLGHPGTGQTAATRIESNGPRVESFGQAHTYLLIAQSDRQFEKSDPGSPGLRPPV